MAHYVETHAGTLCRAARLPRREEEASPLCLGGPARFRSGSHPPGGAAAPPGGGEGQRWRGLRLRRERPLSAEGTGARAAASAASRAPPPPAPGVPVLDPIKITSLGAEGISDLIRREVLQHKWI